MLIKAAFRGLVLVSPGFSVPNIYDAMQTFAASSAADAASGV